VRRAATAADLPALLRLDTAVFGDEAWSPALWAAELEQVPATREVEVLTDASGDLLAYVVVMVVADVSDLQRIGVAPASRRSGLGRELLAAAVDVARRRGCARMLLEVDVARTPAIELYRSTGFVPLHRREGYYGPGRDALVLQLSW
jgi:ribosomal-protein-alanine N-acetyltransferase